MKQKWMGSVVLALALAVLCCGCASKPKTAAEAIETMQAALAQTPCTQTETTMDIAMTLTADANGTLEMAVNTTAQTTVSVAQNAAYTRTAGRVNYGGQPIETLSEGYTVVEDGAVVTYLNTNGAWTKTAAEQTPDQLAKLASALQIDPAHAAVDPAVTTWNGKDVICLTAELSGTELQALLGETIQDLARQNSAAEDAAVDYTPLTGGMRLYLDAKTCLPLAQEITFDGMADVLNPLFADLGITAEVTQCTAAVQFQSCEPQTVPALPADAPARVEAWTALLAGEAYEKDNAVTIQLNGVLVDVALPEGFVLDAAVSNALRAYDANRRKLEYTLYYGNAADIEAMVDRKEARYKPLCNGFQRTQVPLAGSSFSYICDVMGMTWSSYEEALIYAYTELASDAGGSWFLLLEVNDGYNDGFGNVKSADVTAEDLTAYANAAQHSWLMTGNDPAARP